MTKIEDFINLLQQDVYDRTRFNNAVKVVYEQLTTFTEIPEFNLEEVPQLLKGILVVTERVQERDVLQDEIFWYQYLRILEVFSAKIYQEILQTKSSILIETMSTLFKLAKTFHINYGYFKNHEHAVARFTEYANFAGSSQNAKITPALNPHKVRDIFTGLKQDFLVVPHTEYDQGQLVNDGYVDLEIDHTVLQTGQNRPLPTTATTAKVVGIDILFPILPTAQNLPVNFDGVSEAVRRWNPEHRRNTEGEYKIELKGYLQRIFPTIREEQGTSKTDILVFAGIAIECKKEPSQGELDRLVGQIARQKEEFGNVIAVVIRPPNITKIEKLCELYSADSHVKIFSK